MNVKCLVVDDDPLIGDLIKHFCSKSQKVEYCLMALTGKGGLNILSTEQFDLIFLDYNLGDMTGREFLEMMPNLTQTIMVTSQQDFASSSYDYDQIIDFLVKPISYDRFIKALDRYSIPSISEKTTYEEELLFIKDGSKLVRLNLSQILFIKSESNYVSFVQSDKQTMSLMTMKELEVKLPSFFIRVHRSYFVNLNFIKAINQDIITIENREIPIGEKFKLDLLARIKNF